MKYAVTMAHLTGTATVLENGFLSDRLDLDTKPAYSLGQMFFKPYECEKEFIFCANNTVAPLVLTGLLAMVNPIGLILVPALMFSFSLISYGVSLITSGATSLWFLDIADKYCKDICQNLLNVVLLPLTVPVMITRGISTGLKAAGVCDYDDAPHDYGMNPVC